MQRILILGGTGFVGRALCAAEGTRLGDVRHRTDAPSDKG